MWIMERRAESRSGICHMGRLAKNSRFWDRLGALLPRCPLWVTSRHLSVRHGCPLYPQERTFSEAVFMSAKCQKRTLKTRREIAPDSYLENGTASWGRSCPRVIGVHSEAFPRSHWRLCFRLRSRTIYRYVLCRMKEWRPTIGRGLRVNSAGSPLSARFGRVAGGLLATRFRGKSMHSLAPPTINLEHPAEAGTAKMVGTTRAARKPQMAIFFASFMITLVLIVCCITFSHRFSGGWVSTRYREYGALRRLALWRLPQSEIG